MCIIVGRECMGLSESEEDNEDGVDWQEAAGGGSRGDSWAEGGSRIDSGEGGGDGVKLGSGEGEPHCCGGASDFWSQAVDNQRVLGETVWIRLRRWSCRCVEEW